jgi:apolipoprotein D and lipocalin family protein
MRKQTTLALMMIVFAALFSCKARQELPTVKDLDISKYSGTWYEIVRMPSSFEKNLKCVTATYTPMESGKIKVLNRGVKISSGKSEEITGSAKVPDDDFPGRLKVTFFWPFAGNYYVIECADDYSWAMVGDPSRKYLWVLNREAQMDEQKLGDRLKIAAELGFDVEALEYIAHDCALESEKTE